jgi:hypothetical protein
MSTIIPFIVVTNSELKTTMEINSIYLRNSAWPRPHALVRARHEARLMSGITAVR